MVDRGEQDVLQVDGLAVEYPRRRLRESPVRVIDDVTFSIAAGETVALVGESGSGKTTIGRAVLGLAPVTAGRIVVDGVEASTLSPRQRRPLAARLQAVFQNPYGSLNPARTVGATLAEPLRAGGIPGDRIAGEIAELLRRVHLPADAARRYPGQFSGGQRQRIGIARAVARRPRLIVCDEPTSALDVTTQAAVLGLLQELQDDIGCAYLFITHDLAVVRQFADRALVLQRGTIVEEGPSLDVCDAPRHPYTQRLVAAAPVPDPRVQRERRERRLREAVRATDG